MKIDHILFAIDFSDHCEALKGQAAALANFFGAKLTLLHVFEIPPAWSGNPDLSTVAPIAFDREYFTAFIQGAQGRLDKYAIDVPDNRVERVLAEGDAGWTISDYVKEHQVDLVVMGTHGHGALGRLLLGSVTMKVLHDVACPVWTYHHLGHETYQTAPVNIVCSLEVSEEAVSLLRFTKELASAFKANVRLVHVVPGTEWTSYEYFDPTVHESLREAGEKTIAKLQREAGTDFPLTLFDGSVVQDIADFVGNQHADLLVIGRGKAQRRLGSLRTHAYEIIRYAHCPVVSYAASQTP